MLSRRLAGTRLPIIRARRPPRNITQPRPFTQNSQLLFVARHTPRPQLPYLCQPTFVRRPSPLDQQILRLLTTETRRYVKDQMWLATRWTAIGWTFIILSGIAFFGFTIEVDERNNPTPDDWTFWTRNLLRGARAQKEDKGGVGRIDWALAGSEYLRALTRLEEGPDSRDVLAQEDGEGIMIPDVGKAGLDISGKSWQWRAGYFEVLMGCAEAAEHLDDMVLDTMRGFVYPKEVVIGPSNPDPRPTAAYMGPAPLEENIARPFDPPETFYMRVLTGQGFTTKQRLESAWKYANWLEFKGLYSAAEEMYKWAIDISKSVLAAPDTTIDPQTSIIKISELSETSGATPNLLAATTALAIHRARTGDVATALPIMLSVLRARRSAPVSPFPSGSSEAQALSNPNRKSEGGTDIDAAVSIFTRIFTVPKFPPPPPSGDDTLIRSTERPTCEESELMLYVGEILFATSSDTIEGLGWTRQAVKIAESNLEVSGKPAPGAASKEEQSRCRACLRAGVSNWETMLQQLAEQGSAPRAREGGRNVGFLEWRGWFGSGGDKGKTLDEARDGIFTAELEEVARIKERIARELVLEDMYKYRNAASGVWVG